MPVAGSSVSRLEGISLPFDFPVVKSQPARNRRAVSISRDRKNNLVPLISDPFLFIGAIIQRNPGISWGTHSLFKH